MRGAPFASARAGNTKNKPIAAGTRQWGGAPKPVFRKGPEKIEKHLSNPSSRKQARDASCAQTSMKFSGIKKTEGWGNKLPIARQSQAHEGLP